MQQSWLLNGMCKRGANVDAVDKDLATPLHLAAWKGYEAVVILLLGAGTRVIP